MVGAQAEQPRDRLGAEAGRGCQAGCLGAVVEGGGRVRELERTNEARVELGDGDRRAGVGDGGGGMLRQAGDHRGELALGERVVGAEGCDRLRHQAVLDHGADLRLGP